MPDEWAPWVDFAIAIGIAAVIEVALILISGLVARLIGVRRPRFLAVQAPPRRRLLVLTAMVLLQVAVATTWPHDDSRGLLLHVLLIVSIAIAAWALIAVFGACITVLRGRHPLDVEDNRDARRIHTQLSVIRGVGTAVICVLAAGAAFFTIPGAEAVGTSLLASAGLASVVAGIAAQSVLGNVFAGVQLAFSGAIRVGDVVIANGEWGRIEEITLTSVILKVWDERRVVLPSTYFTTTPFENWTRSSTELLGTIFFDVDWRVDITAMRAELDAILDSTPLWDGRARSILVTDATGGMVQVRALISAANSDDQWSLRVLVRERLVEWLAEQGREVLPTTRFDMPALPGEEPASA